MNKRAHRAAIEAKRQLPDFTVDDLTDEQCIEIDAAYDRSKYDPAEIARREHALIQEQQQMLGILRGAV